MRKQQVENAASFIITDERPDGTLQRQTRFDDT